jgi:enterochelin esterase-like enzyme
VFGVSVISWGFIAGLVVAAVIAWVGWRLLKRRRYRTAATIVLSIAIVLSTAGAATGVNRYFSYLPRFGDVVSVVDGSSYWPTFESVAALPLAKAVKRYPHGVTVELKVPDNGSGFGTHDALTWLPPQYFTQPDRRFPVVYLIHGSPGVPADWFRGGQAGVTASKLAAKNEPMIVVAPRMSHNWLDDPECVDGKTEKVETHFLDDVIPTVDTVLRTVASRNARVVGGMSAGGYCALNLGLRHRNLFATIIDMSGFTKPTHEGGLDALFGSGPKAKAKAKANTPETYVPKIPVTPRTRIWLDCGTSDHEVLNQMDPLYRELVRRGFHAVLHLRPGAHTFHVWQPALMDSLTWVAPSLEQASR